MQLPQNRFKRALAQGRPQIGLWCSLPSAFAAEIVTPASQRERTIDARIDPTGPARS
jgi:4-hydroxy-2-oxoheptanedioate aldolase